MQTQYMHMGKSSHRQQGAMYLTTIRMLPPCEHDSLEGRNGRGTMDGREGEGEGK